MIKDICLTKLKQFCDTYFVEALKESGLKSFSFSDLALSKALFKGDELCALVVYREVDLKLIEIDFIVTRDVFRRSGAAKKLLEEFKGFEIWLELSEANSKALKFYESQGFKVAGVRKNYYSNGESALNMFRK